MVHSRALGMWFGIFTTMCVKNINRLRSIYYLCSDGCRNPACSTHPCVLVGCYYAPTCNAHCLTYQYQHLANTVQTFRLLVWSRLSTEQCMKLCLPSVEGTWWLDKSCRQLSRSTTIQTTLRTVWKDFGTFFDFWSLFDPIWNFSKL